MIAIIDYDAGNLTSVARAITYLGYDNGVTRDVQQILAAERIIFPGVGAAGSAMASLKQLEIDAALREAFQRGTPILGICLGTQIILEYSEENQTPCVGLVPGAVRAFSPDIRDANGARLKIPQMGWNRISPQQEHPVLAGVKTSDEFYFVHGYYPDPSRPEHIVAKTAYGIDFASVIGYRNLIATQFHPEKSGRPGLAILDNFCHWTP